MSTNPAPRTVCVDFDGVLADYHGWKNEKTLDPPYPGALEFCNKVVAAGYALVVHTTRSSPRIYDWLAAYGFPPCTVAERKPKALVYIDDRAFRFTGDWTDAWQAITLKTHWE